MAKHIILVAVAIICMSYTPNASALIEGPGVYYGFELPEPFYNYWNYTVDIKDMKALYDNNDFTGATNIFVYGKNNARNATAGTYRYMYSSVLRNFTGERWYLTYANFYQNDAYMRDWFEPVLFGNSSSTPTCCGERASALDVFLRYWQVMYAQHEADAGIRLNIPEEAGHGFAVISSPVEQPSNYWNYVTAYGKLSCIPPVRDTVTTRKFPPTLMAYRAACGDMGAAIANEDPVARAAAINAVYTVMEQQVITQFAQVFLVNTKRTLYSGSSPLLQSTCHQPCIKESHKAAALAAWKVLKPLIAKGDAASIAAVEGVFATGTQFKLKQWNELKQNMATLLTSLGINMNDVYKCK